MRALCIFWEKYMRARKSFEKRTQANRDDGAPTDVGLWSMYFQTKQDAFNELVLTLPEVRYTDFWREVNRLAPQACVDGVLRYRREKAAAKEQEREEKSKTAATKGKKNR